MVFSYVVHDRGTGHVSRGIPCQDSYAIEECDGGYTVAAVADGLGACPHSQVGSRAAADAVTAFIRDNFPLTPGIPSLVSLMVTAMNRAEREVRKTVDEMGLVLDDCHTTLSVCLFNGERLIYGHSGDGIILGLEEDGTYSILCGPDKGSTSSSTTPFTYGSNYWHVDAVDRPLASVLLTTDGIGDVLVPPWLRPSGKVVMGHAAFFMHPRQLGLTGEIPDGYSEELGRETLAAIRNPDSVTWSEVTDDITAAVLVNTSMNPPDISEQQTGKDLALEYRSFYDMDPDAPVPGLDGDPVPLPGDPGKEAADPGKEKEQENGPDKEEGDEPQGTPPEEKGGETETEEVPAGGTEEKAPDGKEDEGEEPDPPAVAEEVGKHGNGEPGPVRYRMMLTGNGSWIGRIRGENLRLSRLCMSIIRGSKSSR